MPVFSSCPSDVTLAVWDGITLVIEWAPPEASDNSGHVARLACDHASGEWFDIGTTAVFCNATDASGNTANCSFAVNVIGKCNDNKYIY